ncbi:MAG: LPS assembly lipoprotein LptE [Polaromonas sp.]|jgi:LPS-assembly lipoprotein
MQRRLLWLSASALGASALLATAGCGFKLRAAPNFAFASIYVNMPEGSTLGNELKRALAANNTLRVVTDPQQMMKSDVILDPLFDQRQKIVVATNAAGLVREFQLRLLFSFRLRTPQGKELIPRAELQQQRDISFNESAVLAKEAEEGLLYRDMQNDIVQQVMRRLAAVQSL